MKRRKEKITNIFNAITFAEAGDHDTAREFMSGHDARRKGQEQGHDPSTPRVGKRNLARSVREDIESTMAAVAFAESGQFGSALDIANAARRPKSVLLAIEGETADPAALHYAAGLCDRMDASLEVLQVIGTSPEDTEDSLRVKTEMQCKELMRIHRELDENSIPMEIHVKVGHVDDEVCRYTKSHKEVAVVVFDSPRAKDRTRERGGWERILQRLSRRVSVPMITAVTREPIKAT